MSRHRPDDLRGLILVLDHLAESQPDEKLDQFLSGWRELYDVPAETLIYAWRDEVRRLIRADSQTLTETE